MVENQSKNGLMKWCFYDWANSAFSTVILTFVFSVYFARGIVGDEIQGSAIWGYVIAAAGFVVAVAAPLLGFLLDRRGQHIEILRALTIFTSAAIFALFFMQPEASFQFWALGFVFFSVIGFELSQVVYNALLPKIASYGLMGQASGFASALGYAGGLSCLLLVLFGLIGMGDQAGFLGVSEDNALHVRSSAALVAVWFLIFAAPLLFFWRMPWGEQKEPGNNIVTLAARLKEVWRNKNMFRFLVASALYRDGLATLFAVGGLYAAGTFGFSYEEIILFGIALNVTAGIGAFGFAFVDRRYGGRLVIMVGLVALIGLGTAITVVDDKVVFTVLAVTLGFFVGPVQSSSRALMAQVTPAENLAEGFGLYALAGKSIAFLGPLCFALMTDFFETQRAGVASIIALWFLGLVILIQVKIQKAQRSVNDG
jgi:UMF1 family MFS transporter